MRRPGALTLGVGMGLAGRAGFLGGVLGLLMPSSAGCKDCTEDVAAMRNFVLDERNQACAADADCVTALVGCADLDLAFCGQIGLSRVAAESRQWRSLVEGASCEDTCTQCDAALVVGCNEGRCFTPSTGSR